MKVGIFQTVDSAVYAVKKAYERYACLSLEDREDIIVAIRKKLNEQIELMATLAVTETGMGNLEDKKQKLQAAINGTPGL